MTVIHTALAHAGAAEIQPLLQLAPTDRPQTSIGLNVAASALRVRGLITARSENGTSTVTPQLHSTLTLASKVKLETRVDFPEWNTTSPAADETIELKLRLRSVVPLIDEIEGRSWRGHAGLTRHALRLAATEEIGASAAGRPITFRLGATIEQIDPADSPATQATGAEAVVSGFGRTPASNRVGIRYRAQFPAQAPATSLFLGRSWQAGHWSRVAVDYTLTDAATRDSRLALTWQYDF